MSKLKKSILMTVILAVTLGLASPAWAVHPPEPESGGRFFRSKGTKASDDFRRYGVTGRTSDYHFGEGIDTGVVNVRPSISYTREYDNNIFLTEDAQKEDWINRLQWGIDGEVPFQNGQHILTGGVYSESEWFNRFDGQDHTDWLYQGGLDLNYNTFSLSIYEEFRRTVDRSNNELTQRIDRKENFLSGLLTIPFGQFFVETEVSHFNLEFRDPVFELLDRQEFQVFPRVGFDVGDRTQFLVEYGFNNINYDEVEDRNGDAHELSAGLRGLLTELITYQVWGGWQFRNYDSAARENFSGFIARGELVYKPSELTEVVLDGERRPVESLSANQSWYVRNEVSLRVRRKVAERLLVHAGAGFRFNDYNNDRLDFYWEPRVGLEYLLPYDFASVFTEYKFTGRESDATGNDYHRTIWNFGVKAEF